ncbi:hypothetical protein MW7_014065 [Imbroritus primus]|uniref:Uncharacterized protein n=1 Tax=Imbroritus primus TaxID=3058603 RepID=A0ACD3SLH4_9BURK|nr:hypothetical protein MW7_014065 [Burkholderiaceae bacterium PBA]
MEPRCSPGSPISSWGDVMTTAVSHSDTVANSAPVLSPSPTSIAAAQVVNRTGSNPPGGDGVVAIPLTNQSKIALDASFDPTELAYQLQLMFADLKRVQSYASAQAAHNQSNQIEDATKETFDALKRLMEQMDKLASRDIWDLVGAVIGTVFSAIFAGVAIAASGGALTAPVAVTMTVLVGSVIQMASAISTQKGGPDFSVNKGLTEGFQQLAEQWMSKEDAAKLGTLLAGIVGTVTIAPALMDAQIGGSLLSGAAAMGGASDKVVAILKMVGTLANGIANAIVSGKAMNSAVKAAEEAGRIVTGSNAFQKVFTIQNGQIVSGAVQGGLGIQRGKDGVEQAQRQHDVDMTQAEETALRGFTDYLNATFSMTADHQKSMEEVLQEILEKIKDSKEDMQASQTRLVRSLAPSMAEV